MTRDCSVENRSSQIRPSLDINSVTSDVIDDAVSESRARLRRCVATSDRRVTGRVGDSN